ncbi:hypothetical protein [Telluribacter sp. SYSU D00476]|uniref:hypothetical protein n=1 Tax=Telluribacter sp. SYSU D00476 TaxID=2811430 RepID=UPI001FF3A1DD|nr:hypothetical protein [Telluribacter sp. SYSU D00476]
MMDLTHLLISLVLMTGLSPVACTQETDVRSIQLTERTRGTYRSIHVTPAHTVVVVNEDTSRTTTPTQTWQALTKQVQGLPVKKLAEFSSGGTRHQVDAALQSQLVVETAGGTFSSPSFDHNRPPSELTGLQKALYALVPAGMKDRF